MDIRIEDEPDRKAALCEEILRALPLWFGIEASIIDYVNSVRSLPMFSISHDASESLGFLSLKSHTILDAEIYLIAVRPAFHGQGLGHALIAHAAQYARNHGAKFMTVKTVGPSCPNPEYEMTRRFYLSAGFVPLKEFDDLWEGTPCLLMMKLL